MECWTIIIVGDGHGAWRFPFLLPLVLKRPMWLAFQISLEILNANRAHAGLKAKQIRHVSGEGAKLWRNGHFSLTYPFTCASESIPLFRKQPHHSHNTPNMNEWMGKGHILPWRAREGLGNALAVMLLLGHF